jgi:hypothetical protein
MGIANQATEITEFSEQMLKVSVAELSDFSSSFGLTALSTIGKLQPVSHFKERRRVLCQIINRCLSAISLWARLCRAVKPDLLIQLKDCHGRTHVRGVFY